MALSAQQMEIARAIDAEIRQIIDNGGGDEEILRAMPDHMSNFKLGCFCISPQNGSIQHISLD